MKDPDVDSFGSQSDSTEFEDDFDFVALGKERIGELFKARNNADKGEKSVAEQMRKNDLLVINKMLEKVIEHEERLPEIKEELKGIHTQLDKVLPQVSAIKASLQKDFKKLEEQVNKVNADLNGKVSTISEDLRTFRDDYFPKFILDFHERVVEEVTIKVNKTTSAVITEEMLVEALKVERETEVIPRIDGSLDKISNTIHKELRDEQEKFATGLQREFEEASKVQVAQMDQVARDLTNTNEYIRQVNEMVLVHEQNFVNEENEPDDMSPAEMEEQGIVVRYGIMFDKDGLMVKMTKKQI